ncbi:class I SAM-dependent methyltransferase [Patescibacteria group bacterium]|nr:class I SAM-dependent methyltransferase [Patescibacteria group bacterium]
MKNDDLLKLNIDFYEKYGKEFSLSRANIWDGMKKIKRYIKDDDKVLDVGCGNGRIATLFSKDQYTGIDSSSVLLKEAKMKNKDYTFIKKNILDDNWYIDLGKYDTVLLIAVLHHIPSRDQRISLFKNLKKILSKNGKIIFSTWDFDIKDNMKDLGNRDFLIPFDNKSLRYVHKFSDDEVKEIISVSGFLLSDKICNEANIYYIIL